MDWIRRYFPRTRLVTLPHNQGFTGAMHAGAQVADGEYLLLINNDMRVDPDWIDAFDEVLRGRGALCATGKVLDWDGRCIDFIEGILLFDGHALQRYQGVPAERFADKSVSSTFIACGGNMAVQKKLFQALGGFDRDFFAYTEDVDLSWRLYAAGYQIFSVPNAVVYHRQQATSSRFGSYRRGFLYERNAFACLYKNIDETYFPSLMHAAWVTLLHRTWQIAALVAPESVEALKPPIQMESMPEKQTASAIERIFRDDLSLLGEWFRKGLVSARRQGLRSTLNRALERAGLLWHRVRSRPTSQHGRAFQPLYIEQPYILSQFQAIWSICEMLQGLDRKRQEVQALRRRRDADIFEEFPPWVVSTYPGDEQLFASPWFQRLLPQEIAYRFATLREVYRDSTDERHHSNL